MEALDWHQPAHFATCGSKWGLRLSVEEDGALMARAARGDTAALAGLYDRHSPVLLAVARRMLGTAEAEDLVHDVFLEAWRRAGDYDGARGSVRAWLVLRTRSRALDRLKARSTRHRHAEEATVAEPAPDSGGVSSAPDRTALREAVQELPVEQRDVLLLGYFEGLSCSEIADRVSVPVGTVKSRVAAALRKLRMALHTSAEMS